MFGFGNANATQREAIEAAKGPVLITAGPGTEKSYTFVQRTLCAPTVHVQISPQIRWQ